MRVFLDTSALLKRYIQESGSAQVDGIFDRADEIVLSPVTRIEACSAIQRRFRENSFTPAELKTLVEEMEKDLEFFHFVKFTADLESLAVSSVSKYSLRTLDSIQLASAIVSRPDLLVTSDKRLADAAQQVLPNTQLIE